MAFQDAILDIKSHVIVRNQDLTQHLMVFLWHLYISLDDEIN